MEQEKQDSKIFPILKKYQRQTVQKVLKEFNGRSLLALEAGLGKTITSLALIQKVNKTTLIICPSALKLSWIFEMKKFWPEVVKDVYICSGQKPCKYNPNAKIYICNYEILQFWKDFFIKVGVDFLVSDESHNLKTKEAKRTKAAMSISEKCSNVILLSGTPLENKPVELWSQLYMIDKNLFPSWLLFAKRFNGAVRDHYGWKLTNATNTKELNKTLTDKCMIRLFKKDVIDDLPDKITEVIPIEIDNRKEYNECKNDLIEWLKKNNTSGLNLERTKRAEQVVKLDKLKFISAKGKIKEVMNYTVEQCQNEKQLFFCYHKEVMELCHQHLLKAGVKHEYVTSEVKGQDRQDAVNRFNDCDDVRVFLSTHKIAGTGLNLQKSCSNIIIFQLPWTPSALEQTTSRVYRFGQKSTCVIKYFIADNTIEEKILKVLDTKLQASNAIIDGKEETDKSELLTELLKDFM